jgi:hypothetical protein
MDVVHTNVMKVPLHAEQENNFIRGSPLPASRGNDTLLMKTIRSMAVLSLMFDCVIQILLRKAS